MDALTYARLCWLRMLESGAFRQEPGQLFIADTVYDEERQDDVIEPGSERHCCIGVWCESIPNFRDPWEDNVDTEEFYDEWRADLDIPLRMEGYLTGMNDGMPVWDFGRATSQTTAMWMDGRSQKPIRQIRYTKEQRDFTFIARYMRKVWGL